VAGHFNYISLISPIRNFLLRISDRLSNARLAMPQKANLEQIAEQPVAPDMQILNCRVQLTKQKKDTSACDAFAVEICGSIHNPCPQTQTDTILKISITDITDVVHQLHNKNRFSPRHIFESEVLQDKAMPVHSNIKKWQLQNSPVFCYKTDLGKLPNEVTTLSDWTVAARIRLDWLTFPRKGNRNLHFNVSVLSRNSGDELACARCTFIHENVECGYIDLQENIQRAKILTVALAFTVSAADKKLYNCEIELIKNWVKENLDTAGSSDKVRHNFDKALNKTINFFQNGNQLNTYKICREIVEIAPVANRYDILELCLYVAQAKGFAAAEELALLKDLAKWLEVDTERFHEMTERILPVNMHQVKDMEVILGVNPCMSREKTRQYLNKQFCKWNSRVTNSDPAIQDQADQMLKLIADARSQYIR